MSERTTTETIIDVTEIKNIREGISEIDSHQLFLSTLKYEIEAYLIGLEKARKECIEALIRGESYPHVAIQYSLPVRFLALKKE